MGLSARGNGINNERLTGLCLRKVETAPIDIDVAPAPNEAAKDGGVVIVTVTNDVLRGAGRCILQIPVNVTSVCCNRWAVCERRWISLHYGDRLCLWLSCGSG